MTNDDYITYRWMMESAAPAELKVIKRELESQPADADRDNLLSELLTAEELLSSPDPAESEVETSEGG